MGCGLYLTYRIGFFQFRHLGLAWTHSFVRGGLLGYGAAIGVGSLTVFAVLITGGLGGVLAKEKKSFVQSLRSARHRSCTCAA